MRYAGCADAASSYTSRLGGRQMTWLGLLIVVAVVIAVAAVSGVRPRGARPVGRTHLMTGARVVLVILAVVIAWALWAR